MLHSKITIPNIIHVTAISRQVDADNRILRNLCGGGRVAGRREKDPLKVMSKLRVGAGGGMQDWWIVDVLSPGYN